MHTFKKGRSLSTSPQSFHLVPRIVPIIVAIITVIKIKVIIVLIIIVIIFIHTMFQDVVAVGLNKYSLAIERDGTRQRIIGKFH
jgi:hypothetical protein